VLERVSIDIAGLWEESSTGNKYILDIFRIILLNGLKYIVCLTIKLPQWLGVCWTIYVDLVSQTNFIPTMELSSAVDFLKVYVIYLK
jgi:hypothetical protein